MGVTGWLTAALGAGFGLWAVAAIVVDWLDEVLRAIEMCDRDRG